MRGLAPALVATHLVAAAAGYLAADRRPVDTEAKHTGFLQVDTSHVLEATVHSLQEEDRLLAYTYKGSAQVEADRTWLWIFGGHQELIVPAVVSYYVDLSDLTLADVSYNDTAKLVTVRLPSITVGDIAFQPENATTINGGLLTFSEGQVEALRKLNFHNARRSMLAQAQQAGLLNAARRQAAADVENNFEVPLRISGQPDVKVVAVFK